MAHRYEAGINECLKKLEAPITNGPQFRWQRKQEQRKWRESNGPLSPLPNNAVLSPHRPHQKSPKKTPKKTTDSVATSHGDRFIPSRSTTDCEWAHYQMVHNAQDAGDSTETVEEDHENIPKTDKQTDKPEGSKILHFKTGAPANKEGYQNNLRVLYCQSKPTGPKAKSTRHIPQAPDRILDAPDIVDDYYLNILDWGNNNLVGLALGGAVYVWNADTGDTRHLLQLEGEDYVSSVSWIKEGSILAVGNCNGQVQLWDVDASKCVRIMSGHSTRVSSLSWNSYILSSGSRSGAIHNHDVRVANHHVATLLNHTQEVCGLKWSLDGKLLASGGNDNIVNIWPLGQSTNESPLFSLNRHQAAIKALSWCPFQSNVLASGGGTADRHIRFWNASTGVCLNSFDTKSQVWLNSFDTKSQVSSLLWSSDYKEIISGHGFSQNQLTIWKYPAMSRVADLIGHTSRVLQMSMSPDRQYVASVAADETLRVWKCFVRSQKQKKVHHKGAEETSNLMSSMKLR